LDAIGNNTEHTRRRSADVISRQAHGCNDGSGDHDGVGEPIMLLVLVELLPFAFYRSLHFAHGVVSDLTSFRPIAIL